MRCERTIGFGNLNALKDRYQGPNRSKVGNTLVLYTLDLKCQTKAYLNAKVFLYQHSVMLV